MRTCSTVLVVAAVAAALAVAVLALEWMGIGEAKVPRAQPLATTLEPGLLEEAKSWPPSQWSANVVWLARSELLVERLATIPGRPFVFHEQLRVAFSPPSAPAVSIRKWTENAEGESWEFNEVKGTASISCNGTGLGSQRGPDLALEWEFSGESAGSLEHSSDKLLLFNHQLQRR